MSRFMVVVHLEVHVEADSQAQAIEMLQPSASLLQAAGILSRQRRVPIEEPITKINIQVFATIRG